MQSNGIERSEKKRNFTEDEILRSKTPIDYIDRCLHSKLSQGEKTALAKKWMKKTGFSIEEINHARNRHPHWKKLKAKGNAERNSERIQLHQYAKEGYSLWSDAKIKRFIRLNGKDRDRYIYKDWELAARLKASLATIQAWRRKMNIINKLFEKLEISKYKRDKMLLPLMKISENVLRRELHSDSPSIV